MRIFGIDRAWAAVRWRWRSSLYLRVVITTLSLSLIVVLVLGQILVSRITSGLVDAKQRSSLVEARAGLNQAEAFINASDRTDPSDAPQLVEQIANQLANRGAGTPRLYDVLLLSNSADLPQRGSNEVTEDSIPDELRTAVQSGGVQASTFTEINYNDGRGSVPGFAIGAPLDVPGLGQFELYYLFPLVQEQDTLDLVRRTLAFAGLVLAILLALISWFVTRQVAVPVREAAKIAEEFSAGRLTERMKVEGADDLAKLARSFNDMAASLQRQIAQLEDMSRAQRRFVSDVSHELRTPLTTVRMAADVLHDARNSFDPATQRSAELLQAQLDRFEALLADLLEVSRFDAGAAVLETAAIDITDVVARTVEQQAPLSERVGCEVRFHRPRKAIMAECDPRRLERILRNLIVNAVEHGEGRPVDVFVARNADSVAISVRDHGVGLRPGESSLVFNRFWRADPARARTTGGTGLGLPISLEDARLHRGWLQAWGEPGDGTNFRLTLPLTSGGEISESPLPLEPLDRRIAARHSIARTPASVRASSRESDDG